jgi:hypothetical protein
MYNSSASYVFLIEFGFKKKTLNRNETARRAGKLLRERVGKLLFKGVKKFGKFFLLLNNLRAEINPLFHHPIKNYFFRLFFR